jgi:hypothetical protein
MGYVYLILEVDKNGDEFYKIGVSKNIPEKRLKQLQTGNPNKIEVLKTYESKNYKTIEKWLHKKYSLNKTQSDNEWFQLTDEEIISFTETCKNIESTILFLLKENHFFKE